MQLSLSLFEIVERVGMGTFIGFAIGLTGVGGGVLVMPALKLLGFNADMAVGTASVYSFFTKVYAVYEHYKLKTISLMVSLLFFIGAVPGTFFASRYVATYKVNRPDDYPQFELLLNYIIGSAIALSLILLLINLIRSLKKDKASEQAEEKVEEVVPMPMWKKITGVIVGLFIGVIMGATGVGGGVLIVPALISFFGLKTKQTVGTSIFIAVVLMMVNSIVYIIEDNYDFYTALFMFLGSLVGVFFGSRVAAKVPDKVLKIIVVSVVFLSAVLMFLPGGGGH